MRRKLKTWRKDRLCLQFLFEVLMKRYILIISVLLLQVMLAQGQHTSAYARQYDWQTGYRDTFPQWVFSFGSATYTGISEPGLKTEIAREQAIRRALFLYLLAEGTNVNMLFDYFTSAKEGRQSGKFIVLATFAHPEEKAYRYTVLNEYVSRYGEVCVSIQVGEEGGAEIVYSYAGEMMLVEDKERKERREFKILLTARSSRFGNLCESSFSYKGNEEISKIEQKWNGETVYIPRGRYMYADDGLQAGEYDETYHLFDGYWCALMKSLLHEIVLYSFPSVYIRKVNDQADIFQYELKREMVRDRIKAEIGKSGIRNNSLFLEWRCESGTEKN